jgi:hypothetical protein
MSSPAKRQTSAPTGEPASAPAQYRPPHRPAPAASGEELEIDLVFNVTSCGTCSFFWPAEPAEQPYGPYPSFDFTSDTPLAPDPDPTALSFPWLAAQTAEPAFPTPEIMDGCRKAPIMTIGINPNLTAFAPGQTGASWCYPNFSSDAGGDLWSKYAYYYRYRSVYQERFELDFIKPFLLDAPRIVASRPGVVVSADRPTDAPSFTLKVRYDGDFVATPIELSRELGTPRWVVLFDAVPPNNRFVAGDTLAAKLDVPAGETVQLYRQQVGYYEQFVPVLSRFEATLHAAGHPDARLAMGEDVCQLDMVACASPHWNPGFLGGSSASEREIVANCVTRNAWAIKQLVQTRPAVLYLVGEATYNMFHNAIGALLQRDPPLSADPADGAFTLLHETTDPAHPCYLAFTTEIDGTAYELRTRLVVTPHFSYATNFMPQLRLAPATWAQLQIDDVPCAQFLRSDERITYVPGAEADAYAEFLLHRDSAGVLANLAARFPASAATLEASFYDPHAMMAGVLDAMYTGGDLSYGPVGGGSAQALARTDGSCRFCVNERWQFPLGCPYDKPAEQPPPPGFLEQVAQSLTTAGRPAPQPTVAPQPAAAPHGGPTAKTGAEGVAGQGES